MKFKNLVLSLVLIITCFLSLASSAQAEPLFKLPDYTFQVPIGKLSTLTPVDCSEGTCEVPFLAQYISAIYTYGLSIAGVLGVLMLMAAGLLWMVSGGDSSKATKAKQLIAGSVLGLTLLLGLTLFLNFINPDLSKNKVISLESIGRIEIEPEEDTDIMEIGGVTIYEEGCKAAKKGDLSVCREIANRVPLGTIDAPGKNGIVKVNSTVYQEYLAAMDCVSKKNGGRSLFVINEAFRSATKQILYKEKWPNKSATPCCSNHSSAIAMDINRIDGTPMSWEYNESSGLRECMNANSLYANLKKEPWHWSPTGK